jgi:hypothetical protein
MFRNPLIEFVALLLGFAEVKLGAVGQGDGLHRLAALLGLGDGAVETPLQPTCARRAPRAP